MPSHAPHICGCGHVVPHGVACQCQRRRQDERKRRADARRPNASARGYNKEWEAERKKFLAAHPRCQRPGCTAPAIVVDHIKPHRGDMRLFWQRSNWQALCRPCHSRWKQQQEHRHD